MTLLVQFTASPILSSIHCTYMASIIHMQHVSLITSTSVPFFPFSLPCCLLAVELGLPTWLPELSASLTDQGAWGPAGLSSTSMHGL